MSVIEAARRRAAEIHRELVGEGFDPWTPKAFVLQAATRNGIEVQSVRKGAAILDGGVGFWDPGERLIVHASDGSAFVEAFVIAHELGHALLGASSDRVLTASVDPARSCDEPETGAERVGDYSRRERREVMMDLFARELLLPREVARRLHLHEGMGAAEVASRLGAPYEAVAQQMLDALLLPSAPPTSDPERPAPGLDESQKTAAEHAGSPFLLEAGPGTGKTRTLVARIEHLLDHGVPPEGILVLTFSNKAAQELVDRVSRSHPAEAPAMWIGTFHAFGLDLVRRFHDRLGFASEPTLLDRSDAVALMEDEFPRLGLKVYRDVYDPVRKIVQLLEAVSRAKDEVVSPERYAELARAMAASDPNAASAAEEVARFYQVYEDRKRAGGLVDFGDLVSLPVGLVEGDTAALAELRARHVHILVDEYQDVNHASTRLLAALADDGRNLWVVGDARQSIYRFRGASSANMPSFETLFPGARSDGLKVNYRSTAEIVGLFDGFSRTMSTGRAAGPRAQEGRTGPTPELRVCGDGDDELDAIAAGARELHAAGVAWSDQAVLCVGNERLAEVAARLESLGVPVLFLGVLFERPEIRDLLSLLTLAGDRYGAALVRLAACPEFRMDLSDAMAIVDRLRSGAEPVERWAGFDLDRSGLSTQACVALDRIDAIFGAAGHRTHPWRVCVESLLDHTPMARRIAQGSSAAERTQALAVWQFLNYARTFPVDAPSPVIHAFLERIRRLVRLLDDRDLRRPPDAARHIDAVRLLTIHGSKGLEFEAVHLPGLHAQGFPGQVRLPQILPPDGMVAGSEGRPAAEVMREGGQEEKRCLFYVALSRARRRLMMYRRSTNAGKGANLTSFLTPIAASFAETRVASVPRADSHPAGATEIRVRGEMTFSAYKLGLYDRCPRRFLYTHVLQLGGRRKETPYMRVHEAVRILVERCGRRGEGKCLSRERFLEMFEDAWIESGPTDHGYAEDYRRIALELAEALWSRIGARPGAALPKLEVSLPNGRVLARVDEAWLDERSRLNLARIVTGSATSDDASNIEYLLLREAAEARGAEISLIHLADGTCEPMPRPKPGKAVADILSPKLASIAEGRFEVKPSVRMCPRCPSYFMCGDLGQGAFVVSPKP